MAITTSLSGNEIYLLAKKNLNPGNIVLGNSVYSLGIMRSIGSGLSAFILGGEVAEVSRLIKDGREAAFQRLVAEATSHHAAGVTGVTSELIFHGGNIEFLSIGSSVLSQTPDAKIFTSAADGQELFIQMDAEYKPLSFAFGNVAYAMGFNRGLLGGLKTLVRGEISEYSDMFNRTRHLALMRIVADATKVGANAVVGIKTTILPFGDVSEMLMIGTAAYSEQVKQAFPNHIVTSDMTNIEMWNMAKLGYAPFKLLLGTSVYSLGVVGSITSMFKSFVRGEINELTQLIYEARENALRIINDEAAEIGADDVVGVKTYIYQLGGGLIEFLAIGTAVKKIPNFKTESEQLPPQAVIVDTDTFYDAQAGYAPVNMNQGKKPMNTGSVIWLVFIVIVYFFLILKGKH